MSENPSANDPQPAQEPPEWVGWWSWPPHGDITPMPGVQIDDLLAIADQPDLAPELVGLKGRPRRFARRQMDVP